MVWKKAHLLISALISACMVMQVAIADDKLIRLGILENTSNGCNHDQDIIHHVFTDIIDEIAVLENWKLEYFHGEPSYLDSLKDIGKIDLLLAAPYSEENRSKYIFSTETVLSTWGQVYVQTSTEINSLLDLEGLTVAFLDGDSYFEEFKSKAKRFNITCDLVVAKDYAHVFDAVNRGFVDAGVVERTFGFEHRQDFDVSETPVIFSPTELRFACNKKNNTDLINIIDYYLALFKRDKNSKYYAVMQEYFGPETTFIFPVWLRWSLIFVGFALLILLIATVLLKVQVKNRTVALSNANDKLKDEIKVRKEHESDLRLLGTVVEQMIEGVIITNTRGVVEYVNPGFENMSGRNRDSLVSLHFNKLFHKDLANLQMEEMLNSVRAGNLWRGRLSIELQKDKLSELEASIIPIREGEKTIKNFLCILRDLTHEAQLERQLRQSQKLEAIGTLAGGIAHDFNNTLFTIMGQTDLAMLLLKQDDAVYAMLQKVIKAGQRAKDLVRQILTFSRRSERERQILEIQPIIKETMSLIRPALPSTIEIRTEFNASQVLVETDPTQIHQILLNLCTNAAQALPENKGTLDVRLNTVEFVEDKPEMHLEAGHYVRLSVKDTGQGIAERDLDRIFEPFFTTKAQGEGTGMGLAVVHGIVNSNKGAITVESEVGEGTVFNIFLPVVFGEVDEAEDEIFEDRHGNERIMVVDDDEDVIEVLCMMLRHLEYQVNGFTDSREALRVFKENPNNIDLLITDFSMPGLTGAQLCEQVLSIRASLPVIMITGYGQYMTTESARKIGVNELMIKPVMISDLSETVRCVLDDDVKAAAV